MKRLVQNWKSGLTVALVSLPLSVSLAVASEATPVMGIITAIWAGFVASVLAGSDYNIIGPTGALSGILAAYAITHGAGALPMLAITAGVFILVAFIFRVEKFLAFVPSSTIHGFTLGVAFIIGLNQLNFALGLQGLEKHERFIANVAESLQHIGAASGVTFAIFAVFLAALLLIAKLIPRVPGAIVVALVGIILGMLSSTGTLPLSLETLGDRFADLSPRLIAPMEFFLDDSLIKAAFAVAVVAILETMISAKIADGMTHTKHDKRREVLGLGMANIASGLTGGIPATAALARTALNVKSGANNKISATLNSIFVAIISLALLAYFKYIPMAVIAAILVFVAIRMVEVSHFERFFRYDKRSFFISLIVAIITIYEDPIIGILVGTAISLLVFVEKLSRGQFDLTVNDAKMQIIEKISGEDVPAFNDAETLLYSIKGQLVYINSQSHIARFESGLNGYKTVILRLRELSFIDTDGIDALDEILEIIHREGRNVLVCGANPEIDALLQEQSEAYRKLVKKHLVFTKASDALAYLVHSPKHA